MTFDESRRLTQWLSNQQLRSLTPQQVLDEARYDAACDPRHLEVLASRL